MKKIFSLCFSFLLLLTKANSQITKGNWLVGGNGSFTTFKVVDEKTRYLQLSSNIGYFLFDKFAAGLKPSYVYTKAGGGSTFFSKSSGIYFGPFARYYFLTADKPFNILLEGSYQHGIEKKGDDYITTNYSLNTFSIAAGPVIYFNTSVGLEFLVGYGQTKYTTEEHFESRFQMGIGLQVHLEKE